ncbi:anti-repressor SinI family protein [Niallia sp. 01092]|uniref:anti-repressor SinI family protein n=1 Tax=unclassified Niallia TaxID=2837522 RepID=UPI003FD14FFF
MIDEKLLKEELDTDWIQLIMEAKKLGMDIQEVRNFIRNNLNDCLILKTANE